MPTLTTLINFNFDSGSTADLITDPPGNLFGTTFDGGANGGGFVFEIVKTGGYFAGTTTTFVNFIAACTSGWADRSSVLGLRCGERLQARGFPNAMQSGRGQFAKNHPVAACESAEMRKS